MKESGPEAIASGPVLRSAGRFEKIFALLQMQYLNI